MIWFLFLPIDLITTVLAYPLAPIIALFSDSEGNSTLGEKNILRLWLTPDNTMLGDSKNKARWESFVSKYPKVGPYIQRVAWLWRNKAYGWSWYLLNTEIKEGQEIYWCGDPRTDCDPYHPGVWLATTKKNPLTARWMAYLVLPTWPKSKCIRIYLGWKLQSSIKDRINGNLSARSAMMVSCICPWKSRGENESHFS